MLHFELVTPAKLVRSESVHMVVVPGSEGDFGVLEGHAPMIVQLKGGVIRITKPDGSQDQLFVAGGLRQKIDGPSPAPSIIETEAGVGYRLREQDGP